MKILEVIVPLVLIVILLACMMNSESDSGFSVGGQCGLTQINKFSVGGANHEQKCGGFKVGGSDNVEGFSVGCSACQSGNGFKPGGSADKTCDVTMVWADWCGFSKKAKPEWDSLTSELHGNELHGYKMNLTHAEEKEKPDIVKKYKPDGFPSYFVECSDKPGQIESFNSIEKNDMKGKIGESIKKLSGGSTAPPKQAPPKPHQQAPPQQAPPQQAPPKPHQQAPPKQNLGKPSVSGEIYYKDCNEAYGPVSLESVSFNLLNQPSQQNIGGVIDCTDLDYAPIKTSLGGPQIPQLGGIPALGQLKAPSVDAVQGIQRPDSLMKPSGSTDKSAKVTMVHADWCGFCKKAKPHWNTLKSELHGKGMNGFNMSLHDLEHKRDEKEIKEKYPDVEGFPTYVVEATDSSGKLLKKESFNSIEKEDMKQKIKKILDSI